MRGTISIKSGLISSKAFNKIFGLGIAFNIYMQAPFENGNKKSNKHPKT